MENLENLTLQELENLKNKINDQLARKTCIILPRNKLYVCCEWCDKNTTRLGVEGIGEWWNLIFHCDNCGKHTKVESKYNNIKTWIQVSKYEKLDNLKGSSTLEKTQFCDKCGAQPFE